MEIRAATVDDVEALCGLLAQLPVDGPGHVPADRARAVLPEVVGDLRRRLLVACDGDRIVGTADVIVLPNLTHGGRPYANVENVVVDASARGQGVGHALMDAVMAHARACGCYKVQLQSNDERLDAHRFYDALGFAPVARGYRIYF